ncbi:MAG: helix-turn-helix domain-containing protein [Parasporobacterium sp.]|nr:helix-turn-helix domain-containing protein [Parasporobacterium sp.]
MKLSLKMIAERIESRAVILGFKDIYSTLRLSRPIFLTSETELLSDTLYITSADRIPAGLEYQDGCAIIISGDKSSDILNIPAAILADSSIDIFELFNIVNGVFDFFEAWEAELERAADRFGRLSGFERFIDASAELFTNRLAVSDPSFNYITSAQSSELSDLPDNLFTSEGFAINHLQCDIQDIMRTSPAGRKLNSEKEIFIISDPRLHMRIMIRNIFREDTVIYRISLTENVRAFRDTDYLFLEYLASYFEKAIGRRYADHMSDSNTLSGLLLEAVSSGTVNRKRLTEELGKISWNADDRYSVIFMTSPHRNLILDSVHYYCMEIVRDFPGVFALNHKENTIVIINHRHFNAGSEDPSADIDTSDIENFMRSNSLTGGISGSFTDISAIRKLYRQAEAAWESGSAIRPGNVLHRFSDCVLAYMVRMSTGEFTADELLSPVYVRLAEYDRTNRTEYLKTLREYLVQNMNAVQTAQALYIHRATLIYRIRRICEIGHTELKKPDELLHLAMSFMLAGDSALTSPEN